VTSPRITFAIPYHSNPALFHRAVQSVYAQTSPHWRLVVSDDGPEPLGGGFAQDPRVRYSRAPAGLGMAGNWNRCLDLADTELVTLLHADDELEPTYAARMVEATDHHPEAAALFCRAAVIDANSRPTFSFPDFVKRFLIPSRRTPVTIAGPVGLTAVLRGCFIMCPTVCYRLASLRGRRFDPRWRFVLDLDLFARLLLAGDRLVGIPDSLYRYRRHPGNATTAYTASLLRFSEESALYAELAARARVLGWSGTARVARRRTMIRLHLAYRIAHDVLAGRLAAARHKLRFARSGMRDAESGVRNREDPPFVPRSSLRIPHSEAPPHTEPPPSALCPPHSEVPACPT
jgi:glycosyltransferase involved in cell wall biosynthesis